MRRFPKLKGILAPILAPMYEDGLDFAGIGQLAREIL